MEQEITISAGGADLLGDLVVPETARALVVFAHGSGSSRLSARNRMVAETLRETGRYGTLLFDLLMPEEDANYLNRFDIRLLADRLAGATRSALEIPSVADMPVGYFGASTGAAAAIVAAARMPDTVRAVVSRGGRPDLAGVELSTIAVPVLLIVGSLDTEVLQLNWHAFDLMTTTEKKVEVVPGATHLFGEPGTLEQAAAHALHWFDRFLAE